MEAEGEFEEEDEEITHSTRLRRDAKKGSEYRQIPSDKLDGRST